VLYSAPASCCKGACFYIHSYFLDADNHALEGNTASSVKTGVSMLVMA